MPERKKISDTCLLNRLVDGEMKAYEEIFVRYYPTLCTYARMYVKREETAENIVQDLMLWLWEKPHGIVYQHFAPQISVRRRAQ